MTARELYSRTSRTGIPDRKTSVEVAGRIFYLIASTEHTNNRRPYIYIDNDLKNAPEILLDSSKNYNSVATAKKDIQRLLRRLAEDIAEDQKQTSQGIVMAYKIFKLVKEKIVHKRYTIEKILYRDVHLIGVNKDKIMIPTSQFDRSMIKVGDTITIKITVPYEVSQARRSDISEHHAEEARNGDI